MAVIQTVTWRLNKIAVIFDKPLLGNINTILIFIAGEKEDRNNKKIEQSGFDHVRVISVKYSK